MTNLLAVEGGWQDFTLTSEDYTYLGFAAGAAILAVLVALVLIKGVLAADTGTDKMREIAAAIQEGASAFLSRQFKTIAVIVVPLAAIVYLTSAQIAKTSGEEAYSQSEAGLYRTLSFLLGAAMSAGIGYIGMNLAVRGNVRTAAAARGGSMAAALKVAFRTGGIAGLFTVGFALGGAVLLIFIFKNASSAMLVGFGFGGSLLALFMRVGGGIFTKAADVGADLVGKVEAGIPEDDPRNPATIADNVGDNVGDCAGMAADLFESYAVTLVASIILGVAAANAIGIDPQQGLVYPVVVNGIGVLASMIGIFLVKARDNDKSAMAPINRGFIVASLLTLVGAYFVSRTYIGGEAGNKMFYAILVGVVLAQVASRITEYFTSTETKPVREIAESTRTGPATTVLSGIASGLESSVWAIVAIAVAIGAAVGIGQGEPIEFTLYLIALTGIGILSTTAYVVSEDTFGPVSDNAAGVAEMSGEFSGEAEKIMVSLDAVGNTTKAVTKGFAIGSAVIAAIALFASYIDTAVVAILGSEVRDGGESLFSLPEAQINVAEPITFIGLLIGGSIAFLFSSLAIRAVGRSAGVVVQEVRRQFREKPGIMNGTERPDYGPVIDICTRSSIRELATPALLAVLTPAIIGFGLGYKALGAFLAACILTGQLMANFLSNSGGAWDNAKKYIEDGNEGGKGSESHKAAVIGDTVGDPFKDTAGPALNPLIKVMNLVALLILPAVIEYRNDDGMRYTIAAVCLVVLLGAILFSKRSGASIGDEAASFVAPPASGYADETLAIDDRTIVIEAIDKVIDKFDGQDVELVDRLRRVRQDV